MKIEKFVFNSFRVNTYVLFDETDDCVIIDPACENEREEEVLRCFISEKGLKPVAVLNTHGHVDHVMGNSFAVEQFSVDAYAHESDFFLIDQAVSFGSVFGLTVKQPPRPGKKLAEGDVFTFGKSKLSILHVPGHSPGSIVFYCEKDAVVIAGDVLFQGSIGRTDLPMGNHEQLIRNIREKLLTLPPDTLVYPGHGDSTSIGIEKATNPFLVS
jgi:hydroxyacylglutathione hydrolase